MTIKETKTEKPIERKKRPFTPKVMRFKDGVRLNVSADGKYLEFNYAKAFAKKITSSKFPSLTNVDPFKSAGEQFLELLNLLESEPIDPFYTLRGEIAEKLAYDYLKEQFETRYGQHAVKVTLFNNKQFEHGDQWHYNPETQKGNKFFGGRIDIGIKLNLQLEGIKRFVVEVKGKNLIDYYHEIAINKNPLIQEVEQGKFLANLTMLNEVTMVYVFFTDEQEEIIQKLVDSNTPFTNQLKYTDVKIYAHRVEFDRKELSTSMSVTSASLRKIFKDQKMPFFYFKEKDLQVITEYIQDQVLRDKDKAKHEKEVQEFAKKEKTESWLDSDDCPF